MVSNSSPLITLARVGQFDLLPQLFSHLHIAAEVHEEVVVRGAGRPAAALVQSASWIEVHPAVSPAEMLALRSRHALGAGELATVRLANVLHANLTLLDERAARRLAQTAGHAVMGCVGLLETGFRRGLVRDLRGVYQKLQNQGIHINRQILEQSLKHFGLPPL